MRVLVAGGSGFIGSRLVQRLIARGDDVIVLTRSPAGVKAGRPLRWAPPSGGAWEDEVASADIVVNLAGESIGDGRWTAARKKRLVDSRLEPTRALVQAVRNADRRDRLLVSTSAVGFYGLRGEEILDERGSAGSGFLASLTREWEAAAAAANGSARVAIVRFGVVLDDHGGALPKMLLPFWFGVGGRVGSGDQWMSWITRDDAVRAVEWVIGNHGSSGVYNVTAPEPVRNRGFARAAGRVLHRPALLPAPAFAMRLLLGEMASELLLGGQRVVPARLEQEGFEFESRTIEEALRAVLHR